MSTAKRKTAPRQYVKGQIAASQIKAIHAAIGKLGIDDEQYRHMLHSRYGATSCKDLTWRQAEEFISALNGSAAPPRPARSGLKYADMDSRPGFASGAQLRLLDAMWGQVSRAEGDADREKALDGMCRRILNVAGLRMVKGWQVEKMIKALEAMGAKKLTKG